MQVGKARSHTWVGSIPTASTITKGSERVNKTKENQRRLQQGQKVQENTRVQFDRFSEFVSKIFLFDTLKKTITRRFR